MTIDPYSPRTWKDTDSPTNPANGGDPFLDADTLNEIENQTKIIVDAIISLQQNGYNDEQVRDVMGVALKQGAGISVTVNDAFDTITVSSTITQYTDEMAHDAVAALIAAGTQSGIQFTYDDANNKLSATVSYPVISVAGKTGPVTLVKGDVGLGSVDNTADVDKPVSTAQAAADAKKQTKYTQSIARASTYTAQSDEIVPIDTSGGAVTIIGPTNGGVFGARWTTGTVTQPTIQAPTGYTIRGAASIPMTLPGELEIWQAFGTDYQTIGGNKSRSALATIFAPIANPTFTGSVTGSGNASSALQLVPKQQLDAVQAKIPVIAYQSSDQTIQSSTTMTPTGISLPLTIGLWAIDGWFYWQSPYAAGAKITALNTANITGNITVFGPVFNQQPVGSGNGRQNYVDTGVLSLGGLFGEAGDGSYPSSGIPHGFITVTSADNLVVSFAQNTSTAANTTFRAGSWLRAQKLN